MTPTHFAEGQILFREGDPADGVFRLLSGTVDVLRELDSDLILLGTVGAGQLVGEMGVVENRPRSATVRAAGVVEAEFLNPTEFLDQIVSSPRAARELIQRLSQRLREADDRIVNDERRAAERIRTGRTPTIKRLFRQPITHTSLPKVRGCSVSSTLRAALAICRSSSVDARLQGKSWHCGSQTLSSMIPRRSGCRATTS